MRPCAVLGVRLVNSQPKAAVGHSSILVSFAFLLRYQGFMHAFAKSAVVQKTLKSGVGLALVLATAINGFLALMVTRFAWELAHNHADRFDGLDIAVYVLVISVPISALCLFGLLISIVLRVAGHGALGAQLHSVVVLLAGANILAPVLLWSFLKWAAS